MKKKLVIVGCLAIVAMSLTAIWFAFLPVPKKVHMLHSSLLKRYAEDRLESKQPVDLLRPDVPPELASIGVVRVRNVDRCVVFTLETFVTESTQEIVFSPKGFRELPVRSLEGPFNILRQLEALDSEKKWYYWTVYY